MAKQAPPRHVDYVPLTTIEAAPRNPKRHDAPGIAASIGRYGLAELPLIDERTGRLVAGHGRLDDIAQRRINGEDPPDGVQVDTTGEWLVPVIRGWGSRSDAEAEAYVIASNKLTMRGGWDDAELGQMLTDLAALDAELLTVTGFDADSLAKLLAGPDHKPEPDAPDDFPEYDENISVEHTCPSCGYAWSGGKTKAGN